MKLTNLIKRTDPEPRPPAAESDPFGQEFPYIAGTREIAQIVPPIPPPSLRGTVGSASMAPYLVTGDAWFFVMNKFLPKDATVLDVACGCGKIARLFVGHPSVAKYIGFDNHRPNIEWCRKQITPFSNGKFEFYFYDIASQAINPAGKLKGTAIVFPAKDNTVSFVLAASVFTHLLEIDTKHYLSEVKRVLKPAGLFLVSILTNPQPGAVYSGTEARIDIEPKYFARLANDAGLTLIQDLGQLCGQDAYLFKS